MLDPQFEAYTFQYYLQHQTLPSLADCQADLSAAAAPSTPSDASPTIVLTPEDYLGALADLTGELMRYSISMVGSSLGSAGGEDVIKRVGEFVRGIKGEMDPLSGLSRWLPKKLIVLDQSLGKIESGESLFSPRSSSIAELTI